MKFYGKKLSSLEELRREKQVLLYAKKHTASETFIDLKSLAPKGITSSTEDSAEAGVLGTLFGAFGRKSMFNTIMALAPPLISVIGKRTGRRRRNPLERVAKEVIFGYVKWKAIQFAYNTVMGLAGAKKDKKDKKGKEHRD